MELSARIRKTWFYLINAQNFDQNVKATLSKICNLFRETVYIKKAIIWISGFSFLSFIRRNTSHFVLLNFFFQPINNLYGYFSAKGSVLAFLQIVRENLDIFKEHTKKRQFSTRFVLPQLNKLHNKTLRNEVTAIISLLTLWN